MLFSVAGIYDSWITVGITTGDSTSAMGSIGFQWDQWTATTGLNTTNGAVFWTNPDAGPTHPFPSGQVRLGKAAPCVVHGTKEMMQPCLTYLHVISSVAPHHLHSIMCILPQPQRWSSPV